jgi:hypothetical protein
VVIGDQVEAAVKVVLEVAAVDPDDRRYVTADWSGDMHVVDLDRERAVGVWISALETVRVRQISGSAPLRFIRGVDGHAAVVEPGRAVVLVNSDQVIPQLVRRRIVRWG